MSIELIREAFTLFFCDPFDYRKPHKNKNGMLTEAKMVKDQPFTGYSILSLSYLSSYKWKDVLHWTLQVKNELLQVYVFTSEPGQMLFMDSPWSIVLAMNCGSGTYSLFPLLSFKYEWIEIWNVNM